MASIRELKKEINYLTYELLNECFTYKKFHPKKDPNKIDDVIGNIIKKRNELIYKIHHTKDNPGSKELKAHYNSVIRECNEDMVGLMDKLKEL